MLFRSLAQAKRLAAIQKFGAILSNIDLDVCAKRRIPVLPLRRVVNMAVAEQAFALMIAHDSTEIMSFFMIYINVECF